MLGGIFKTWGPSHKLFRELQKDEVDLQRVEKLITRKRADVNYADDDTKWTVLGMACLKGKLEVVRLLLDGGADIERATANQSPLSVASSHGQLRVVKLLVDKGADINPTKARDTPLCLASRHGHTRVVQFLLKKCAYKSRRKHGNRMNTNPLYESCRFGHLDVVKLLLARGADLNAEDQNGESIYLALKKYGGIRKALQDEEERREARNDSYLNAYDDDAVATRQFLEEVGKRRDTDEGRLQQLLGNDQVNVNCTATNGWTPLCWACWTGNLKIVKLLLENKANPNGRSGDACSPLFLACGSGDSTIVRLLLKHQAIVDSVSRYSVEPLRKTWWTPLMRACFEGQSDLVRILLDHDADYEWAPYTYGRTPIFVASSEGHVEIVRMLLEKGASTSMSHPAIYINDMNELIRPEYTEHATSSNTEIMELLAAARNGPTSHRTS